MDILILSIIVVSAFILFLSFLAWRIGLAAITASVFFILIGLVFLNAFPLTTLTCGETGNITYNYGDTCTSDTTPPLTLNVINGTLDQGTVLDLAAIGGNEVVISENTGSPFPIDVRLNFSNNHSFDSHSISFFGFYDGSVNHELMLQVYNFTSDTWNNITRISRGSSAEWFNISIGEMPELTSDNISRIRFAHYGSGSPAHDLHMDMLLLVHDIVCSIDYDKLENTTTTTPDCKAQTLEMNTNEQTYTGWAFVMLGLATLYALILEAYKKDD